MIEQFLNKCKLSISCIKNYILKNKKKSFDSYAKKPLRDEVSKAMKKYFKQLDQNNLPIDVYQLVLKEVELPLLNAVMEFSNYNQRNTPHCLIIHNLLIQIKNLFFF